MLIINLAKFAVNYNTIRPFQIIEALLQGRDQLKFCKLGVVNACVCNEIESDKFAWPSVMACGGGGSTVENQINHKSLLEYYSVPLRHLLQKCCIISTLVCPTS